MEIFIIILFICLSVVFGVYWGEKAQKAAEERGNYDSKWFWKGFFRGHVAVIEAMTSEDNTYSSEYYSKPKNNIGLYDPESSEGREAAKYGEPPRRATVESGFWRCQNCGSDNADYTGTCSCGTTKKNNVKKVYQKQNTVKISEPSTVKKTAEDKLDDHEEVVRLIGDYKKLLDAGAITLAEYEEKKKELLNMKF